MRYLFIEHLNNFGISIVISKELSIALLKRFLIICSFLCLKVNEFLQNMCRKKLKFRKFENLRNVFYQTDKKQGK